MFRSQKRRKSTTTTASPTATATAAPAPEPGLSETLNIFFKEFRNEPAARAVADRLLERLKQNQMSSRQELCPTCGNKTKPSTKKEEKSRK